METITAEEPKSKNSLENFKDLLKNTVRVFKILLNHMPWLTSTMILLTIIIGVIPIFSARALGILIDKIIEGVKVQDVSVAYPALIMFAVLTAVPTIIRNIISFMDRHLYLRMQDLFDLIALKKRGSFDIAQYEDPKFQDRLQRAFNNSISPIINIVDMQFSNLEVFCGIVVGAIAAAFIDWRVFLIVFATSIPDFWVEIKYGGRIWGIWSKNSPEQRRYQDLRRFFNSKVSVIDSRLYQAGEKFLKDIKDILDKFRNEQLSAENWRVILKIGASIFAAAGLFIGIAMIINEAIAGVIAIGTVVFAFQALNRVSGWISSMLSITARLLERNLYATDIFAVFDQKPILEYSKNPQKLNFDMAPKIVFDNVSFRYPGQDKLALQNVSFTIDPGQKIGLVGNNAAGKSTLVRLLLRIHDPVDGKITVNGINLKDVDINEWWKHLGVLLQDFTTYNFSVKESIAVGKEAEAIDMENVKGSAKKSTTDGFIENLQNKYDHMIGVEFGGIEPSKGQRQKLAVARAFYKGKRLLVLDEPTASIDADSANIIFSEIENLPNTTSAIIISHNFATIKRADEILVLHEGKIIEKGKHQELLDLGGRYADAFNKQKKDFE
jgi:ABC-type multidrug transport system fused ATPase/permease subunit